MKAQCTSAIITATCLKLAGRAEKSGASTRVSRVHGQEFNRRREKKTRPETAPGHDGVTAPHPGRGYRGVGIPTIASRVAGLKPFIDGRTRLEGRGDGPARVVAREL